MKINKFIKLILFPVIFLTGNIAFAQLNNPVICKIYGSVYLEQDPKKADFKVYLESSEAFADLIVFIQNNRLYADKAGLWYLTESPNIADFRIYITESKKNADFTICYTKTESFAGCPR
ncbi:MAG: hypothetical protein H7329_09725 [Opitutaceae bacterium]|nr:hypothetical protein [Cytophagales bacterium]